MSSVLGYWNFYGLCQPIRFLLHHVGEPYKERLYAFGPAPEYSKEEWLSDKPKLGVPFPNLPYYFSGKVKLTQSTAILRHLARKYGLVGQTEEEHLILDLVEQQAVDARVEFARLVLSPDAESLVRDYIKDLPNKLKPFSEILGDKKWLIGDRITYVDFILHSSLTFLLTLHKTALDAFPNLKEYVHRLESLPSIKAYIDSEEFRSLSPIPPSVKVPKILL